MKFIKAVFKSIGLALSGVGALLGFLIYWLIYSLVSYFLFSLLSFFSSTILKFEGNKYITSAVEFIFIGEYSDIVEILFVLGLGLIIAISKFFYKS